MKRIAQFFRALAAVKGLRAEEIHWVQQYLAPHEEALFWQMSPLDQKHAVTVSMRAATLARHRGVGDGEDIRVLIRAGLLHDIGKIRGDISLFQRVAIVLARRFAPRFFAALIQEGADDLVRGLSRPSWRARWRRAFYTQAVHAERGAAMAKMWGIEDAVLDLIRAHHQPQGDDRLLEILAEADG